MIASEGGEDLVGQLREIVVTVVIVTYRSKAELPDCVASLKRSAIRSLVVIIDNDSCDGTLELAHELATQYSDIRVVDSGANLGLAAANNLAIPFMQGPFVLILNPDTVLEPDALERMVSALDAEPQLSVVGPLCVYEDGGRHTSYHYGWNIGHLVIWRLFPYSLVRRAYDKWARYQESNVYFVSGACLMIRRSVFETIGGYDPKYFLTVEDAADLCRRARDAGGLVRFLPSAKIRHYCGRSNALVPFLTTIEGYKGSIYYFRKYSGAVGAWSAYIVILLGCLLKAGLSVIKVAVYRRDIDRSNLAVYKRILPMLLKLGPSIAEMSSP